MWLTIAPSMMALTVTAASPGLSSTGSPAPGVAAESDKTVTFVGFSSDESMAAWRVEVRRRDVAARHTDAYVIMRVVDTSTNLTLATYRHGELTRHDAEGRRLKAPAGYLELDNPEWREALAASEWDVLAQKARFRATAADEDDVQIRAELPGEAARPRVRRTDGETVIEARPGIDLGFSVTLLDARAGGSLLLGRYRQDSSGDAGLRARVRVSRSPSGRLLAVLSRFESGAGDSPVSYGKVIAKSAAQTEALRAERTTGDATSGLSNGQAGSFEDQLAAHFAAENMRLVKYLNEQGMKQGW